MRFLLFLLFIGCTQLRAQTPCSDFDRQVDSVLATGYSAHISFLKLAFHKHVQCLKTADPQLFDKIRYFDFILKGDNDVFIGMIDDHYVLLDKEYQLLKAIDDPSPYRSDKLEILPFKGGYAKIIGPEEKLMDENGTILTQFVGKKVYPVKHGVFVQKTDDEVVFVSAEGQALSTWKGTLWGQEKTLGKTYIRIGQSGSFVLLDEDGQSVCNNMKSCLVVQEGKLLMIKTVSGQAIVLDTAGTVVFTSDDNTDTQFGLTGCIVTKNGQKGFLDFQTFVLHPLDDKNFFPVSNQVLGQEEKGLYRFATIHGQELYPHNYKPASEWKLDYFYKGDTVFQLVGTEMMPLPVTKAQWMKKTAIGNSIYVIRKERYCLFNAETREFLEQEFDKMEKEKLGDWILSDEKTGFTVSANERFKGFLCKLHSDFFVMDSTLTKRISPVMDTIFTLGPDTYKFRDRNGKWGFLSAGGQVVCSANYDDITRQAYIGYIIIQNDKRGIIDSDENSLIPCEYKTFFRIHNHFIIASKEDQNYLFDIYGRLILDHPVRSAQITFENGKLNCYYPTESGTAMKTIATY